LPALDFDMNGYALSLLLIAAMLYVGEFYVIARLIF